MIRATIITLAFVASCLLPAIGNADSGATVYIKVKKTQVRSKPLYFADSVVGVSYGDAVEKVEGGDAWWKVKAAGGKIGYLPVTTLSDRKIILTSTSKVGANQPSSSDVVLAGKGFSKDAEKQLAATDKKLNFAAVNRMEAIRISDQEIAAFISSGSLSREG